MKVLRSATPKNNVVHVARDPRSFIACSGLNREAKMSGDLEDVKLDSETDLEPEVLKILFCH